MRLLRRIRFFFISTDSGVELEVEDNKKPIDERIAELEEAREDLVTRLDALEDLEIQAKRSKTEVAQTLRELKHLRSQENSVTKEEVAQTLRDLKYRKNQKKSAAEKARQSQQILKAEVDAFRKLTGNPNETQSQGDKVDGFWTGVAASVVASFIFGAAVSLFPYAVDLYEKIQISYFSESADLEENVDTGKSTANSETE